MHARTLSWIGVVLVGAVISGAFLANQARSASLRSDIGALKLQANEVRRLEDERTRLIASQTDPDRIAALRADRMALGRVRSELATLQNRVARLPNPRTGEAALVPAAHWTNAGRATAAATVETAFWSGRAGDVDQLASLLAFDEPVLTRAKTLFERLPDEVKRQHGSAERLVALLTARDATYEAMQIAANIPVRDIHLKRLQAAQPEVTGMAILQVTVQKAGQSNRIKTLVLRQQADGWRLVVPAAAIENYAVQLTQTGP